MEASPSNATLNSSSADLCVFGPRQTTIVSLIDILTFLIGKPVTFKVLWIIFTSKKSIDILNCNLALFHSVHYSMTVIHLVFLFLLPQYQGKLLRILYTFAQTGGSVSLVFICMERYIAVIYPTSYHLLKRYRCREACALTVWLLTAAIGFSANCLAGVSPLTDLLLRAIPCLMVTASCALMIYYNSSILRALMRSAPDKDELHPAKKRALRVIRVTTLITLCCYIPTNLLQLLLYKNEALNDCLILPLCVTLLSAASLVHPLFYLDTQVRLCVCLKGEKTVR